MSLAIPSVRAILCLDADGARVAVKYYAPPSSSATSSSSGPASTPSSSSSSSSTSSSSSSSSSSDSSLRDLKSQVAFEKKVYLKSVRSNARMDAEIMLYEQFCVVYKVIGDVTVYVIGSLEENELLLYTVLSCLDESIQSLLKNQVSKRTLIENLDLLLLCIDEIIDDGLIVETDASLVVGRVCMLGGGQEQQVPISEQTFTQALQTAKDQLVRSFR